MKAENSKPQARKRYKDYSGIISESGVEIVSFSHWRPRPGTTRFYAYFNCRCKCGKVFKERGWFIENNHQRSCGCTQYDNPYKKHGMWKSPEYAIWLAMNSRCRNENDPGYKNYGGRGVRVYEPWKNDFSEFIKDVGLRPSPKHSIDRIDNNGNYEPGNVRWATKYVQDRNKRSNVYVTYGGKTMIANDWDVYLGRQKGITSLRKRQGMSDEEAITSPISSRRKNIKTSTDIS